MKWKYVEGYENVYKIYENGDVYKGDYKMKLFFHKKHETYQIMLSIDNVRKTLKVARLVYASFIKEIPKSYIIIHKDGNKKNLNVNNLKMVKFNNHVKENSKMELDKAKKWKFVKGYDKIYKISDRKNI